MLDNLFGKIDTSAKLNEREARLAPTSVAADLDVGIYVWNNTVVAIKRLLANRLEEEVHGIDEALSASRPALLHKTAEEANQWNGSDQRH